MARLAPMRSVPEFFIGHVPYIAPWHLVGRHMLDNAPTPADKRRAPQGLLPFEQVSRARVAVTRWPTRRSTGLAILTQAEEFSHVCRHDRKRDR